MKYYKDKEDGKLRTIEEIKTEFAELLGISQEFEKYRNNLDKYIQDFYEV